MGLLSLNPKLNLAKPTEEVPKFHSKSPKKEQHIGNKTVKKKHIEKGGG